MRREPHIPLFLWVTTALVVHALGGGGATEVAKRLEETLDIKSFASEVRAKAKFAGPLEVTLDTTEEAEAHAPEEVEGKAPPEAAEEEKSDEPEFDPVDPKPEEASKPPEEPKPEQKPPDAPEEKFQEPPQELQIAKKPRPLDNRRVSVAQHVKDKNQAENPDAEFAGEHANHVEEQTQARITATDQNAEDPNAGENHAGADPEPGNSDEARVAQSDENDVAENERLGDGSESVKGSPAQRLAQAAREAAAGRSASNPNVPTPRDAQTAQTEKDASDASAAMTETHRHANGSYSIAEAQRARAAQKKQEARAALARVIAKQKKSQDALFGYGSSSTTERGVKLNLDQQLAAAVVGQDQLDNLQREVGKRRLSKHRGSWQSLGLERWRGAIENYVASVKPGNQTALNTAAVPFAAYLNHIHQRLHDIFAHGFLGHLEQLPPKHPLNNQDMSTHLEIALSREDGRIVKMGITKSSGVTAFDVGALESVSKAAPYGPPPSSIVSSDGNVYLHWEFHRKREYACSTYFARPYIIDLGPDSAPPRVDPPKRPDSDEKQPDERSGALEQASSPTAPEAG